MHHPAQHQAAQTRRASRGRRRGGRHHGPQLARERTVHHVNICTLTPSGTDGDQTQTQVCPRFAQMVLEGAEDEGTEGASLFRVRILTKLGAWNHINCNPCYAPEKDQVQVDLLFFFPLPLSFSHAPNR